MSSRLEYYMIAPEAIKIMLSFEGYVNKSGLEQSFLNLIKLKVSQINGCAYKLWP